MLHTQPYAIIWRGRRVRLAHMSASHGMRPETDWLVEGEEGGVGKGGIRRVAGIRAGDREAVDERSSWRRAEGDSLGAMVIVRAAELW